MNFNQFQKELRDRGIDGPMAVMLTTMYERIMDNSKQLDQCATILVQLTETVQNVVGLHEHLKMGVDDVRKRMGVNEEEVSSVAMTDEEDYKQ